MPITISHPAVSIPFRRFGLILSALIIGSIIPDFEFFLKLSDGKVIGHTFWGIFCFCIPVGLAVLVIFHKLVKFPLLSLFPQSHQEKIYPHAKEFRFFPARRFLLIIISLVVGIISHLFWDSFTHHDGFMVKVIPFLGKTVFSFSQFDIRLYFILQYVGSIGGLILLAFWYKNWISRAKVSGVCSLRLHLPNKTQIVSAIILFSVTCGVASGCLFVNGNSAVEILKGFITRMSIVLFSALLFAILVFGIIWNIGKSHLV
ncbi:MAG: DUF4184 family protein [Fibrobacter sp.]|nr:DUF4184 family protein [Fibrobacter sp.]